MSNPSNPGDDRHLLSFDDIVQIKAENQALLAELRSAWRDRWDEMSYAQKAALKDAFDSKAREISAQFGRSHPFVPKVRD